VQKHTVQFMNYTEIKVQTYAAFPKAGPTTVNTKNIYT